MNVPVAVGVPLIVIVFEAQEAVTPAGRPIGTPIPVAPVVLCVIAVSGVCTHRVGAEDAAPAVLTGSTTIIPVADTLPQPPVSGIV